MNFGNQENKTNVNNFKKENSTVKIDIPEIIFVRPANIGEHFDGVSTSYK